MYGIQCFIKKVTTLFLSVAYCYLLASIIIFIVTTQRTGWSKK